MSIALLSLMFAAGGAAFMYSKFGPRLGYDNQQNVWAVVGISFVFVYAVTYTFMRFVIGLE